MQDCLTPKFTFLTLLFSLIHKMKDSKKWKKLPASHRHTAEKPLSLDSWFRVLTTTPRFSQQQLLLNMNHKGKVKLKYPFPKIKNKDGGDPFSIIGVMTCPSLVPVQCSTLFKHCGFNPHNKFMRQVLLSMATRSRSWNSNPGLYSNSDVRCLTTLFYYVHFRKIF